MDRDFRRLPAATARQPRRLAALRRALRAVAGLRAGTARCAKSRTDASTPGEPLRGTVIRFSCGCGSCRARSFVVAQRLPGRRLSISGEPRLALLEEGV